MPVELSRVEKTFGDHAVLKPLDLTIAKGDFMVLVGPSGCGKSTLLRLIAGLEAPSAGRITFAGRDGEGLGPRDRGIAMVFQSYALYPHMTVRDNMTFALKLAKMPRAEIDARVDEAAAMLGISAFLHKKPGTLSGGQKQRVAMGRALVRRPAVFLFDEPLSNLDAQLRVKMRTEIAELHRRLGATMIYVTHDQVEAMTLATNLAVMRDGHLLQVGPPLEVFARPKSRFVASFIGSPAMNLLPLSALPDGTKSSLKPAAGCVEVGIRPEDVTLAAADGLVPLLTGAEVRLVEPLGALAYLHLRASAGRTEPLDLVAQVRTANAPAVGTSVNLYGPPSALFYFDRDQKTLGLS